MFKSIQDYYLNLVPAITPQEWAALEGKCTVQQLKKGSFYIKQGDVCRQVSFINRGLLRMFYLVDGREICTGFIGENDYMSAYQSFLTQQPAPGYIDALEDCELINLSYDTLQEMYKTYPVFETVGRKIAEMLFIMIASQTTRLLTLTPEQRYQSVIQHEPFIIQRVPQYMIASYIGITPEHLSRIRKKISGK